MEVHRTVLELHSETELQRSDKQLDTSYSSSPESPDLI